MVCVSGKATEGVSQPGASQLNAKTQVLELLLKQWLAVRN
jgi:hypothetical protein